MIPFQPDLIVEVTSACNRACKGCYAPNVVSTASAQELIEKDPSLFLDIGELQKSLISITELPEMVSIRGGEPTLHPYLSQIINVLKFFSGTVVLETHGRWLLRNEIQKHQELLEALSSKKVIVKVSFDSMHGLRSHDLFEILGSLAARDIEFRVAITEASTEEQNRTRSSIQWVEDEKIIFQKKASTKDQLISPPIGVINSKGILISELTSKASMNVPDLLAMTSEAVG